MRELEFVVDDAHDGVKVQGFLRGACNISYRLLVRLKRVENGITADGMHVRTIDRLKAGSVVKLRLPEDTEALPPYALDLDIVYEDDDILVINKPPAMAVHPSPGHDDNTLANAVCAHYEQIGEFYKFRPVYRLDRDTSGLILIAKNTHCAAVLGGNVKKLYYAVCEGLIEKGATIDLPIRIAEGRSIMREVGEGGVSAVTHFKPIGNTGGHTLLELELETGRTHQIRVHLSHIGHPLAGDDMYGGKRDKIGRQALHCGRLWFTHPITGENLNFYCPLPDDMKKLSGGYEI